MRVHVKNRSLKPLLLVLGALILIASLLPAQAQAATKAKLVKKDGWYTYHRTGRITMKGRYIANSRVERLKASAVKNGKHDRDRFFARLLDARSFKLAKKIKYGKFTITWNKARNCPVKKLHPTKKISAAAFKKAINKKAVSWVCLRVKNGKVVEARWMSEMSTMMLD